MDKEIKDSDVRKMFGYTGTTLHHVKEPKNLIVIDFDISEIITGGNENG